MNRKPTYQELEQKIKALEQAVKEAQRRRDALPQEVEKKYRILTESNADIIYRMDAFGNFTFFNSAAVKLIGYSESDLIGKALSDIVRSDYRTEVERLYSRQYVRKIPITYFELPLLTRDQRDLWVGQNVHLIVNNNQIIGLQAIARDITAHKQEEENLRKSEKIFASTFHLNPDPMAITDTATGRIINANQAFAQWTGYSPEEFIGASTKDLNLWINLEDREEIIQAMQAAGELDVVETIMRQRNGNVRNVLFSARFIDVEEERYLLTIVHDIIERRQTDDGQWD